jgi:hypothetical protein
VPIAIPYPFVTGFREGFPSVTWKIARNNIGFGFKSIEGGVKRDRGIVWGANSEPIGKTRGKSTYTLKGEVLIAEWYQWMPFTFGAGWMDQIFSSDVQTSENGVTTKHFHFSGCTLDESSFSFTESADPLYMTVEMNPLGMTINGIVPAGRPLVSPASIG